MVDAMNNLVQEHRFIEQVLASLETFVDTLGEHPEHERRAIRQYVRFFKDLVDRCHHGKEENYLFVKMNAYGFSKENGPVSAMLSEQGEGRDHLLALESVGNGEGTPSLQEQDVIKGHALGYILRIRPHMAREENILFPIVSHSLPRFVLEELGRDFEEFDSRILPAGFHDELREIAADLCTSYPPRESRTNDKGS
jgi:hemerythrin-like domain-containing protein